MKNRIGTSKFLAFGIVIGFVLFSLSQWWIGAMSLSIVFALIVSGVVIIAITFGRRSPRREGER